MTMLVKQGNPHSRIIKLPNTSTPWNSRERERCSILQRCAISRCVEHYGIEQVGNAGVARGGGHGHAQVGHLGEVGTLAAEDGLHVPGAFGLAVAEEIRFPGGHRLAVGSRELTRTQMRPVKTANANVASETTNPDEASETTNADEASETTIADEASDNYERR